MGEFDSMNEMLIACVKASGGSKVIGPILFPDKVKINKVTNEINTEPAQRWLLNCLDESRAEKITPDQALVIMRAAREKSNHVAINYICTSLGYTIPSPIQKQDENAELMKKFIDTVAALDSYKLQLQSNGVLKAAA